MLFNTYEFIFLFLPIVFVLFWVSKSVRSKLYILTCSSYIFYGYWNPWFIFLMLGSSCLDYWVGEKLYVENRQKKRKFLLLLSLGGNLGSLGFFKYYNFFADSVSLALNSIELTSFIPTLNIILPIGISFYTFQSMSYTIDIYRKNTQPTHDILKFLCYVSMFPQLVAGPIVRHSDMIYQFDEKGILNFRLHLFLMGLSIFFIGLFKKVIIADTMATYATPVFNAANTGLPELTFFSAWGGVLAYTFQLYYDFSGYSDMAIGIGLLFGIRFPLNFYSPYKATNIIDFWKRWHMTLSRFLRDYLYIPLGGNRKGKVRKHINLIITMLLGGLWHGAGWTFVIWGALHGCYLMINHAWRALRSGLGSNLNSDSMLGRWIGRLITFVAVMVAWVFFRADNFDAAFNVLIGMSGLNGFILPSKLFIIFNYIGSFGTYLVDIGFKFVLDPAFNQWGYPLLLILLVFTWSAPNTHQFMAYYNPTVTNFVGDSYPRYSWLKWRLNRYSAVFIACLTFLAILGLNEVSEFIYFQF